MSQEALYRNFVAHVREREENAAAGRDDYVMEFLKIRVESDDLREDDAFKSVVGMRIENMRKNRYRDILPFDYSRVTVHPQISNGEFNDYINASFIYGALGKVAYIATQGPLKETLTDFWSMIDQYNVKIIIMLCDLMEAGKAKCEQYWPDQGGKMRFGKLLVTSISDERPRDHYSVRKLLLSNDDGKEQRVWQLQYFGWPDHGTPDEIAPLLEFVERIRELQPLDEAVPIVAHCSAGCGRTGTICALDHVRTLIKAGKVPDNFSVQNLVLELRKQRPAMVQSKEQYALLHRAIKIMFEQELDKISSKSSQHCDVNTQQPQAALPIFTPPPPPDEPAYYSVPCPSSPDNCGQPMPITTSEQSPVNHVCDNEKNGSDHTTSVNKTCNVANDNSISAQSAAGADPNLLHNGNSDPPDNHSNVKLDDVSRSTTRKKVTPELCNELTNPLQEDAEEETITTSSSQPSSELQPEIIDPITAFPKTLNERPAGPRQQPSDWPKLDDMIVEVMRL